MRYRRPRPPPVRPAQIRRLRARLVVLHRDGTQSAGHFMAELTYWWGQARTAQMEVVEWRGKARWYAQQNRAWLALARSAWRLSPTEVTALIGEADAGE